MLAHPTAGSKLMDLFFMMGAARAKDDNFIIRLFTAAFGEDDLNTMKALFYNRDVRGGQGERRSFRVMFRYLCQNYPEVAIKNLQNVIKFGRWDDLFEAVGTPVERRAFHYIEIALRNGDALCAKWMPRENKARGHLGTRLRKYMTLSPKQYRKMLSGATRVVESYMCGNLWEDINYSHVPSKAMTNYRDAFARHDPKGFAKYLSKVESGEAKINSDTLFPHEIVSKISRKANQVLEEQWKALPNYMPVGRKIMPIIDVSGSMYGLPMNVAVGLGIYLAERNEGIFKDCFITFSGSPKLQQIKSKSLYSRVNEVSKASWAMNTNLEAVFKLILTSAIRDKVPENEMPDSLLILSDMQFDQCVKGKSRNAMDMIKKMYKKAGYKVPTVVFWNLRAPANVQAPVKFDEQGTALVSGFSPSIMKTVLEGTTPFEVMMKTLGQERYDSVVV